MGRYQQRGGLRTKRVDELLYRGLVKGEERGSINRTPGNSHTQEHTEEEMPLKET